jgi:CTP:phosphocholine cytidylyltransferase-like protein
MNYKLFNVLVDLYYDEEISDNNSINELKKLCLYDGFKITDSGMNLLNEHEIDNAIILAAGLSSRFVPVSFDKPKGLLEIKGEILIERQIRQLREKGIEQIVVVIGYKKEQFYYLKDKYNIILIETDDFLKKNNYSSVYAARKYLKNSIITSSDLYFSKNLFQLFAYDSYYCSIFIEGDTDERGLVVDETDKIINTYYNCHDIWVSLGYAFFSQKFSEKFIEIVSRNIDNTKFYNKFWADIQDEYLSDLYMYIKRCKKEDIHEFDSLKEVYDFQNNFKGCQHSEVLRYICSVLKCDENELFKFSPISVKGLFKICSFKLANNLYYFVSYSNNIIDLNEICKTMPNLKFTFMGIDIEQNKAVLKIQEEYND